MSQSIFVVPFINSFFVYLEGEVYEAKQHWVCHIFMKFLHRNVCSENRNRGGLSRARVVNDAALLTDVNLEQRLAERMRETEKIETTR